MKKSGFALESLQRRHPLSVFDCGQSEVNDWPRTKAFENQEKRISATKVLLDQVGGIAGFYTIATGQIDFAGLPSELARKLPRRALAMAILAWLGVSKAKQGQRLGDLLLAQALRACHEAGQTFAFTAVILDCVEGRPKAFYQRWDFAELPGNPYRLFLSFQTMTAMLALS